MTIEASTSVEELVTEFPGAVSVLLKRDLPCLVCGEPVWGTIGELAADNGWTQEQTAALVEELRAAHAAGGRR